MSTPMSRPSPRALVDHLQGLGHPAPVASPNGGQVRDLGPAAGRPRDAEALRHGLQEVVGVVPDVPGEQPVVCGDGAAQRDQLVLLGEADRGVDEAGGQPDGAVLEALAEETDHPVDLRAGGRARVEADGGGAERAVGDQGEDVEGGPSGADRVEVAGDGGPVDADVGVEVEVCGGGPDLVEVGVRGAGATPRPQLPTTWVVVPWVSALGACGDDSRVRSLWVWMSTNPGRRPGRRRR